MEELTRRSNDDLCAQYAYWMGSSDLFSIIQEDSSEWTPLAKLRYKDLKHENIIASRASIVWSVADIWMVHYCLHSVSPGKSGYAIQSIISKDPASYFLKKRNPSTHFRVNRTSSMEGRLPNKRPIGALLNDQLVNLMETSPGRDVSATDQDYPLHQFITTTFNL
jgi:hypothetical protein